MILDLIKNNASYDTIYGKPSFLEKRGNKTLIRLNVQEVFDKAEEDEKEKLMGYSCYEVYVTGTSLYKNGSSKPNFKP